MAKQPEHIIPFRPFASGIPVRRPILVQDERRKWFSTVSGEQYAKEVFVPGTGAWDDIEVAPPTELVEVIRLRLPRPEPLTVIVTSYFNSTARFRRTLHLYAHVNGVGSPSDTRQGRLFFEWGTGKSRYWTYSDLTHGALQIPACSEIRVSAWSHTVPALVNASIQMGYAQSQLDMTWTQMLNPNPPIVDTIFRRLPSFAKTITGYVASDDVNDYGRIILRDNIGTTIHEWRMRPAIVPNPQTIPYAPVDVPLTGAAAAIFLRTDPFAVPTYLAICATLKIRI